MEIILDYFLIAVVITFIILYVTAPLPKIIVKYPSVNDEISGVYVDDNNVHYRYHRVEVDCVNK